MTVYYFKALCVKHWPYFCLNCSCYEVSAMIMSALNLLPIIFFLVERLIVVAEDKEVYERFPIPLINRLEKHFLGMETLASDEQQEKVEILKNWARTFSEIAIPDHSKVQQFCPEDVFVGFHDDAIASLVLGHEEKGDGEGAADAETFVKNLLLQCAAPDAISRLAESKLPQEEEKERLFLDYHLRQQHGSLSDFLLSLPEDRLLVQITTSSRLLTNSAKAEVAGELGMREEKVTLLSLLQFDTEEQFTKRLQRLMDSKRASSKGLIIIQSEMGQEESQNLVECARYIVQDVLRKQETRNCRIVFILHIPRVSGGCFNGLCAQPWASCHIDELRKNDGHYVDIPRLKKKSIAEVFQEGLVPLDKMITESLAKAASMVEGSSSQRMSARLDILIRMMESEGSSDIQYFGAMKDIITAAVENKMRHVPDPNNWLVKMAIGSDFLREGNTFQKSVWLHLSKFVTDLLKDVIRFCDADDGLDLLEGENPDWVPRAFLAILPLAAQEEICGVLEQLDQPERQAFRCHFPLSRYLVFLFDNWSAACGKSASDEIRGDQLQEVLEARPQGHIVRFCFERGSEAVRRFVHDFVLLKMDLRDPAGMRHDRQVEFFCLLLYRMSVLEFEVRKSSARDLNKSSSLEKSNVSAEDCEADRRQQEGVAVSVEEDTEEERSLYLSPVDVHAAFVKHESRFNFLRGLCSLVPELPNRIEGRLEESKDDFGADLIGFKTILQQSEPEAESMVRAENREKWASDVERLQRMHHHLKTLPLPESAKATLREIEATLRRLSILKIYLRLVCLDEDKEREKILCTKLKPLKVALKSNKLKTGKELDKLVGFLIALNEAVGKYHFGSADVCIICREDLQEPVKLPCQHWGCQVCLEDHFASKQNPDNWICPAPDCEALVPVPTDFAFQETEASGEAVEQHRIFKGRLNAFFMDVLQGFVFHGEEQPDDAVIEKLLSFVVTRELPKDKLHQSRRTKQLSPFAGHCVDATPVIRSFILKLLLQGKVFSKAQSYLNLYLEEERKFVKDPSSHVELCLLVAFSLEDRLFAEDVDGDGSSKNVVSKALAYDFLKTCSNATYESVGDSLTSVAKARIALETTAYVLQVTLNREGAPNEENSGFLKAVEEQVNGHKLGENMKKYLVRLLVKNHRRGIINEWKKRQLFVGLLPREIAAASLEDRLDNFLVLGEGYKRVRDSLSRSVALEDEYDNLIGVLRQEARAEEHFPLALHYVCTLNKAKEESVVKLREALREPLPALANAVTVQLLSDSPTLLEIFPPTTGRQEAILTVLFHLQMTLKRGGGSPVLAGMRDLATDPDKTPFLPTMPQDETVEVTQALQGRQGSGVTKWYTCPNGHIYGIGDCGVPVGPEHGPGGMGACPDCKNAVGGQRYNM